MSTVQLKPEKKQLTAWSAALTVLLALVVLFPRLGLPLGDTAVRGMACMLNWIGEMPDPTPMLSTPGGHWHDYGKQPRAGRKVGHATLRADEAEAEALAQRLADVGQSLGRQAQVAPVVARLREG